MMQMIKRKMQKEEKEMIKMKTKIQMIRKLTIIMMKQNQMQHMKHLRTNQGKEIIIIDIVKDSEIKMMKKKKHKS